MGAPSVERFHAAHQAVGGLHGDGANAAFADVLRDFADDVDRRRHVEAFAGDADGVVDLRDVPSGNSNSTVGSGDLNDFAYDYRCAVSLP